MFNCSFASRGVATLWEVVSGLSVVLRLVLLFLLYFLLGPLIDKSAMRSLL